MKPIAQVSSMGEGSLQGPVVHTDSGTESEAEDPVSILDKDKGKAVSANSPPLPEANSFMPSRKMSPVSVTDTSQPKAPASDSESSPRPAKKPKPQISSSDEDSEAERKKRVSRLKSGSGPSVKRGTRQPIKRGGKRF
jgi:hypothetical protein